VTIAPELPGALMAIGLLAERGVIAAIGHTDATYEQTLAGISAGASVGTHVCNAMRPMHHRDPGPIVALLGAEGVVCEQVADGVHLHDGMLRHTVRAAGPHRMSPTPYRPQACQTVRTSWAARHRHDGVARLVVAGAIAGSTLTMDAAVRRTVTVVSIAGAARMAARTPARALGIDGEIGAIVAGHQADLVLLDDELRVVDVTPWRYWLEHAAERR
jgi:N-acetylglucosamine-6-phosphate deacetylase